MPPCSAKLLGMMKRARKPCHGFPKLRGRREVEIVRRRNESRVSIGTGTGLCGLCLTLPIVPAYGYRALMLLSIEAGGRARQGGAGPAGGGGGEQSDKRHCLLLVRRRDRGPRHGGGRLDECICKLEGSYSVACPSHPTIDSRRGFEAPWMCHAMHNAFL